MSPSFTTIDLQKAALADLTLLMLRWLRLTFES